MKPTEAGHTFLARLGKTRLRPGGVRATDWLLDHAGFAPGQEVLEIACNMGTTAIEIAKRFGVRMTGLDRDETALDKARANAAQAGLADRVSFLNGNAMELPFPDSSLDIVINEAMLTMYAPAAKEKLVREYWRVLKPGGRLLTQDVMLSDDAPPDLIPTLQAAINVQAQPLTRQGWTSLFLGQGFREVTVETGPMSLLSPMGLIRDEGLCGATRILRNALKPENRDGFKTMYGVFSRFRPHLNFIAVRSLK